MVNRWDNRSGALANWLYGMRYRYASAAPSPERDQFHLDLTRAMAARLAELIAQDPDLGPPAARPLP
jgi:hypothetical protein